MIADVQTESCFDSIEEVSPSLELQARLPIILSSEESGWFIDYSSEQTSSASISASVVSFDDSSKEESSLPSSPILYLFVATVDSTSSSYLCLLLSLEVIIIKLRGRKCRGRDWSIAEDKRTTALVYVASAGGQFEKMSQSWRDTSNSN
jgi:hypothetical protein